MHDDKQRRKAILRADVNRAKLNEEYPIRGGGMTKARTFAGDVGGPISAGSKSFNKFMQMVKDAMAGMEKAKAKPKPTVDPAVEEIKKKYDRGRQTTILTSGGDAGSGRRK